MDESRQNRILSVSGLVKPGVGQHEKYRFPGLPGESEYLKQYKEMPEPTFHPGRPFYMQAMMPGNEKSLLQDLEYLKRMYPEVVHGYMDQVSRTLDKLDYEGSMIYDEYPDYYQLKRLSKTVVEIIRRKEMEGMSTPDGDVMHEQSTERIAPEELLESGSSEDKWVWVEYLVRILVSMEVFKRRNRKSRYY